MPYVSSDLFCVACKADLKIEYDSVWDLPCTKVVCPQCNTNLEIDFEVDYDENLDVWVIADLTAGRNSCV